jgi:7,8-dihydroneopterin aldolase/epimerase/oxygenase
MDYIHITNLSFRGKHGMTGAERKVEQEFSVEVKLGFDTAKAGVSDKLADTINYSDVRDKIQQVIEGSSHYLVESLAEEIAHKILEDRRIILAEITIKKMTVWDNGVPGITIVRNNN